jgi:steroid delta-isomerase-like uncharacterized protein
MSAEQNKALVRRWFTELDNGNLDAVDELIAADYVDHNPAIPGLSAGREGVRQANVLLNAAFPDAVHTIRDQIAEGDKVMTRVDTRGTFAGEFLGLSPTGRVVEISGIAVHRVAEGRLVEHWAHADMAAFMQQVGAVSMPEPPR